MTASSFFLRQELEFLRGESEGQQAATRAAHLRATEAEASIADVLSRLWRLAGKEEGGYSVWEGKEAVQAEVELLAATVENREEHLKSRLGETQERFLAASRREAEMEDEMRSLGEQLEGRSSLVKALQKVIGPCVHVLSLLACWRGM